MMTATLAGILALGLLAVIALARHLGDRALMPNRLDLDDPLRVVDEMFARGEIDLKDYQDRRARLRKLERR